MKKVIKHIVCFLPLAVLCACGQIKEKVRESGNTKVPTDVTVSEIIPIPVGSTTSYIGTVKASKVGIISVKYPGKLEDIYVRKGDYVRTGDVVALIPSESVNTSLQTSKATYDYAKDAYDRIVRIKEDGAVTEQKFNEVLSQYFKAEANYNAAQNALEDCRLKAPYDGVIGEIYINEGESVSVGEAVAKIYDTGTLEVEISVPESEVSQMKEGEDFIIKVAALGDKTISAILNHIGIEASPISHSYTCTLSLTGDTKGLKPGMVCSTSLSDDGSDAIVIPADAVHVDSDGRYVWIVVDNVVEKRYVSVGGFAENGVVIDDGLYSGELIITEGAHKISSGMSVNTVR